MDIFMYCSLALSVASVQTDLADEPAKQVPAGTKNGGLATFYFLDPIANEFSFAKARYSMEIDKDGHLRDIADPDIDFGNYQKNSFTIAFAGGLLGKVIDLGTADDLREKYRYTDHVGKGDGYASIHKKDGKLLILGPESQQKPTSSKFQPMEESKELFGKGVNEASAAVKLGHIYVLRVIDTHNEGYELVVKLKVVEYRPGELVTIRWQLLQ